MSKKVIIAIIVLCLAGTLGFYYYNNYSPAKVAEMEAFVNRNTLYNKIDINGIEIGGLTKEEALNQLKDKSDINKDSKITVTVLDKSFELPFSEALADYDYATALDEALKAGKEGDIRQQYKAVKKIEEEGLSITANYSYDEEKVNQFVSNIKSQADVEKKDSEIKRDVGRFQITDEVVGIIINSEETKKLVANALDSKKPSKFEAVYTKDEPKIKRADNEKVSSLIGSFETSFSAGYVNRNTNLKVGCEYINGTVIAPGEEFSMEKALGEQTYARGYRNAAVYVNGKTEDGMGGGVCQISTTVYNAAIRAELKITERMNHSLPVGYVPLGLDAAIADGYKDLKFVNDTEYPIYLEAYIDGTKLICNLYGNEIHDEGRSVEFEKVYISSVPKPAERVTEDPNLEEGERKVTYKGSAGHVVQTFKKVFENGELVSREFFSESRYRSVPDEVTVGTKPKEADSDTATPIIGVDNNVPTDVNNNVPTDITNNDTKPEEVVEPIITTPEPTVNPNEGGEDLTPLDEAS